MQESKAKLNSCPASKITTVHPSVTILTVPKRTTETMRKYIGRETRIDKRSRITVPASLMRGLNLERGDIIRFTWLSGQLMAPKLNVEILREGRKVASLRVLIRLSPS